MPTLDEIVAMPWLAWASEGLLAAGMFFLITGALGVLRFPDFYTRLHPSGVAETFGMPLLLLGLAIMAGWSLTALKLILLMIFLLFTGPTACHALAKAAWLSGLTPQGENRAKEKKR